MKCYFPYKIFLAKFKESWILDLKFTGPPWINLILVCCVYFERDSRTVDFKTAHNTQVQDEFKVGNKTVFATFPIFKI